MVSPTPVPEVLLAGGETRIARAAVSEMDNRCYLITCARTGASALIDAAADADALLAMVAAAGQELPGVGVRLDAVVTTHAHWDHVRALAEVIAASGARAYAGGDDVAALPIGGVTPLSHGDRLAVGRLSLEVIALRGHTPGSIALALVEGARDPQPGKTVLFTGDSLFPGGVGATGGDPRRFARLLADVEQRVFARFPDETWVLPGHGRGTMVGVERPQLDEWRERGW